MDGGILGKLQPERHGAFPDAHLFRCYHTDGLPDDGLCRLEPADAGQNGKISDLCIKAHPSQVFCAVTEDWAPGTGPDLRVYSVPFHIYLPV